MKYNLVDIHLLLIKFIICVFFLIRVVSENQRIVCFYKTYQIQLDGCCFVRIL